MFLKEQKQQFLSFSSLQILRDIPHASTSISSQSLHHNRGFFWNVEISDLAYE